jgi:hypothetical protein
MIRVSRRNLLLATAKASNLGSAVAPSKSTTSNLSSSFYAQAMRKMSTRRGMSTQPPTNNGMNKTQSTTVTATPKKSSFPVFTFTATIAVSALAYLAYELEQENPQAQQIAEVPYVQDAVEPFTFAVRQLREYGLLDQKPVKPAPRQRSPSPPPRVEPDIEKEEFKDTQYHGYEQPDAVSDVETVMEDSSSVESSIESQTPDDGLPTESSTPVDEETIDSVSVTNIPVESTSGQSEGELVAIPVEENTPHTVFSDAPLVETHHEEVTDNTSAASVLPPVSAEKSMHSIQNTGSVGEVLSTVAKNSIALRHELEAVLLKDIHNLDAAALRIRITQLAAEMFERLSWETIRLSHSVRQVENELTEKYEGLMAKQRKELEFEINRILFERECELNQKADHKVAEITKKYQEELNATIKAQAEGFQATVQIELENQARKLQTDFEGQFNHQLALVHKKHSDTLLSLQPKIESLQADLKKYDEVIDSTKDALQFTLQSHAVSSAVLALELILSNPSVTMSANAKNSKSNNISAKLNNLRSLCKDDALVMNLLDALPSRVKTQGALTLPELQVRFQVMRDEVRKAALAPEAAPKLIGQLVGTFLATISAAPKGLVAGQGTEEALARAAYYLDRGKIKEALKELDGVQGYSKVLMEDWKDYAKERLIVDQALRALKADSIVRHKSFSN